MVAAPASQFYGSLLQHRLPPTSQQHEDLSFSLLWLRLSNTAHRSMVCSCYKGTTTQAETDIDPVRPRSSIWDDVPWPWNATSTPVPVTIEVTNQQIMLSLKSVGTDQQTIHRSIEQQIRRMYCYLEVHTSVISSSCLSGQLCSSQEWLVLIGWKVIYVRWNP